MERKASVSAASGLTDIPTLFGLNNTLLLTVPTSEDISQSRRSSYCGQGGGGGPVHYNETKRKIKQKERQDWLKKYTPLSSARNQTQGGATAANGAGLHLTNNSSNHLPTSTSDELLALQNASVDPNSDKAYKWLTIISFAVVYYFWVVIARTTFAGSYQTRNPFLTLILVIVDITCNVLYALDMYIQSHTGYLKNGILETKAERTSRRYRSAWKYYIDIVSVIPFDVLLDIGFHNHSILLWVKLLKLYRLQEFHNITENRTHYPNACRFAFLLHYIMLIIHWNACVYYFISRMIGFGSDRWVYPAVINTATDESLSDSFLSFSSIHSYIYCFYWSTLTLTTIGGHPEPATIVECIFMTVDYLVGIIMFATLVGNIGGIISNMRKGKAKFQGKLDRVKSYMKAMDVPTNLQARVIKWFDYLWTHGHPVDNETALNSLPDKLKAEIAIHVHFETLKKVDFFDHCDQSFLWELVLRLQIQVYSPGDYVCRKGDVGREMYIVSHGKLEVVTEEDGEILRILNHGDYFGEISVLNIAGSHRRRTAFVRSVGYSDLLCLSQNDLFDVLYDYPQAMEVLQAKGKEKLGNGGNSSIRQEEEDGSDVASSFNDTEYSDDLSDATSMGDTPATQADVRQITEQLLDLQLKMYEIQSSMKDLTGEIRNQSSKSRKDSAGGGQRRHSLNYSSTDEIIESNGQLQILLTPPSENGRIRSSSADPPMTTVD